MQQIRGELADKLQPLRNELENLEREYREEADEGERARLDNHIDELRKELKKTTKSTLDDYLPEVFALVKDTCRRLLGQSFVVREHETGGTWCPSTFN